MTQQTQEPATPAEGDQVQQRLLGLAKRMVDAGFQPVETATEFLACSANVLLAGLPPADVVKLIRTFADAIESGTFEKQTFHGVRH